MIDFFQLISIGAALSNLVLTLFLLKREFRSSLNRVYFLWGICITIWNIGVFFMFNVGENAKGDALFWARLLHFGVIFLPVSLLHLACMVAQIKVGRWIYFVYGLQFLFALTNFGEWFIADVKWAEYAWYSKAGPAYWPFLWVYSLCAGATLILLYNKQKEVSPLHRVRLHSLMVAAAILIVFGINDIGPILGVYKYPGTNIRIYPLGSLAAIFYSLIISYSILQHQLLDIHVTLGKFAAHLVRLLFLVLTGFALLLTVGIMFPNQFELEAVFIATAVLTMSGALASVFFPRIFGEGSDSLERRILGDRFEYHDKIQAFINAIPWYSDTTTLLRDFQDLLVNTVKLKSYQIILNDELNGKSTVFHAYPVQQSGNTFLLGTHSKVFDLFRQEKFKYLPLNRTYAISLDAAIAKEALEELQAFEAEFCFPVKSQNEPFGLVFLGGKWNGEPFTANDLYLFDLLIKSLASALNQIRLKNKVLKAEELELLGRMSRGMAHDLNNLLTPISTFIQLCSTNSDIRQFPAGLLNIAGRNLVTIRDYIQEALFFSQTHTPCFKYCRLDLLINQVLNSLVEQLHRKAIKVKVNVAEELTVEMDEILIQRLFSNLISNAIDASHPEAEIILEAGHSKAYARKGEGVFLRVSDSGTGITRENLKRVLKPYFTTKIHGDETRGVGLGLAICDKIVQLHSGSLSISSEENKGTTVQIFLPIEQSQEKQMPAHA